MKNLKLKDDDLGPMCWWCGGTSQIVRLAQVLMENAIDLPCCELGARGREMAKEMLENEVTKQVMRHAHQNPDSKMVN